MQINRYTSTNNTSRRTGGVRHIVVHYTGSGTSRAGSALANCKYFSGGNRNASADFFVDDSGIWQYNPDLDARYTWHCGDGHGRYGITNSRSIGIEVCSGGEDFTTLERGYLRELVRWLMDKYGIAPEQVVRHYDASRKCCPEPYAPNGGDPSGAKWHELHAFITSGKDKESGKRNRRRKMECILTDINGINVWAYFDGHDIHDLTDPDDIKVLDMVYNACYGEDMPRVQLGSKDAPWASRLYQVVNAGAPVQLVPSLDDFEPRTPKD